MSQMYGLTPFQMQCAHHGKSFVAASAVVSPVMRGGALPPAEARGGPELGLPRPFIWRDCGGGVLNAAAPPEPPTAATAGASTAAFGLAATGAVANLLLPFCSAGVGSADSVVITVCSSTRLDSAAVRKPLSSYRLGGSVDIANTQQ